MLLVPWLGKNSIIERQGTIPLKSLLDPAHLTSSTRTLKNYDCAGRDASILWLHVLIDRIKNYLQK